MHSTGRSDDFDRLADLARSLSATRRVIAELAASVGAAGRDVPGLLAWVRGLPRLELALSEDPAGEDIRGAIMDRHNALLRGRAVAVLTLPASFEDYLRGRHRQAVRTNRTRGLRSHLQVRRARTQQAAREAYTALTRHRVLFATEVLLAERIDEWLMQLWFVTDEDGDTVAAASVTVDGDVARFDILQVALDIEDRSAAQYLLSSELIRSLIGSGVRYLLTDSMLFAEPGIVYLQDRLGFEPMNIVVPENRRRARLAKRRLTQEGARRPTPAVPSSETPRAAAAGGYPRP